MVTKESYGYTCDHCGNTFSRKKKAERHEETCGNSTLGNYTDASKEPEPNRGAPLKTGNRGQNDEQLSLGEKYIGKCPRCNAKITDKHQTSYGESFYECPSCGKELRKKK